MENKFKSRKFIAAIWAAGIFTILGILSLAKGQNEPWLGTCMPLLVSIVLAYIGGQTLIDKGKK